MGHRPLRQRLGPAACPCRRPPLRLRLLRGTALTMGRRIRRLRTGLEGFFLGAEFF